MSAIASAWDLVTFHESLRRQVYDDATGKPIVPGTHVIGHPTVGYGRALDVRGITKGESEYLMKNDMAKARVVAERHAWFHGLSEPRQAVCLDMIHNLGAGGFWAFRKMISALARRDFEEAGIQLLDSKYAEQVRTRALRNYDILIRGAWPAV